MIKEGLQVFPLCYVCSLVQASSFKKESTKSISRSNIKVLRNSLNWNVLIAFLFSFVNFKFIQQLIKRDSSDVDGILLPPEQQDESIWKYEHVREFCLDLNLITVRLQAECNPATCTQMTATEQWIFLCAAHKNPKEVLFIFWTWSNSCYCFAYLSILFEVHRNRLHSTHTGRRCLPSQQQSLLLEQVETQKF